MPDRLILQFSTTPNTLENWTSAVIRRLGHSRFSHVDFVLPDGNLLGASDQGPTSPCIAGNPRGVAIRPPDYQEFGLRRQMILATDTADAVVAKAMTQLGKPFDSSGMWGFLEDQFVHDVPRDWRNPDAWWCSEHKAWSLEGGGFFGRQLIWPKNRVSPTDLFLLLMMDPRFINHETFWEPVPGLKLGVHEH